MRFLAEDFLNFLLNFRHPGHTADQNDFVDVAGFQAGIGQSLLARFNRAVNQIFNKRFQFGAGQFDVEMFRTGCVRGNERQVDIGLSSGRQLDFGFFGSLFQTLQSQTVAAEINSGLFFELIGQIVDNTLVKVFAAEESIAVGGFYFENAVADFQNGNIKRTAAEVINGDGAVGFFVHTVSQSRCRRFVDDTQNFQSGNFTGVFGCLTLRIVKICRNRNNGLLNFFTQIALGIFLNLLQNDCGNLRRGVFLAFYFNPGVSVVAFDDFKRNMPAVFGNLRRVETAPD